MMFIKRYLRTSVVVTGCVFAVTGCGNRNAQLTGQVVDDGRPITSPKDPQEAPTIFLRNPEIGRSVSFALTPEEGRFVAYAPDGTIGLPTGKYKVGFTYATGTPKSGRDFTPDSSPIEIELEAGDKIDVTIDAAKRTVTQ
jgi:hypothetical protein